MLRHSNKNKFAGFSIVEVMIALIVLSGGILALSKFQGQLFQSAALSAERAQAQSLAQRVIDYYRSLNQTTLSSLATTCSSSCNGSLLSPSTGTATATQIGAASYTTTWQITSSTTSSNTGTQKFIYRVDATVSWNNAQGSQTHQAYVLILPN
ncbi:hypothetical protein [Chitinibacter sp. S2-10]|uniref:type IV pilus modification PilV family protein n=1 Tax=Chitinibacter sp. S2-10 TaxID=3373597 RepID=UPI0039774D41